MKLRDRFLIGAAAVLLIGTVSVIRLSKGAGRTDVTEPVRDTLRVLRTAVDSCQARLAGDIAQLDAYQARLDTLRARVRRFEALDPRGVPADSYAVYMRAFDAYNDSVPGWTARADTLRARWVRCTSLTARHNVLADSLRRLLIRLREEALRERG